MILYHERRCTKDGKKRCEMQVEEVSTSRGPRYIVFALMAPALSQPELKQEWLFNERERAVRESLAWFDMQVKELFAGVAEGQVLEQPVALQFPLKFCDKHQLFIEPHGSCGKCQEEPPQPEKVTYVVQYYHQKGPRVGWEDEPKRIFPDQPTLSEGQKVLADAREYNEQWFAGHKFHNRLIKRTTRGNSVTEEVVDA